MRRGEQLMLAAVGFDSNDNMVGGISYTWEVTPQLNKEEVRVSEIGSFVAYAPGTYKVIARGAGRAGIVTITVEDTPKNHHARPMTPQSGGNDLYEWRTVTKKWAIHPLNERGNPPNRTSVGGASSGNFQLNVPLVFLPGRGLDVDLKLQYNSRVWTKTTTNGVSEMTFDIDKGTPAVGWSFGFGKIINMLDGGAMMVDSDGTRHGFAGEVRNNAAGSENSAKTFIGSTTDGTFIDYVCHTDFRAAAGSDFATAKYPNGTVVGYFGGLEPTGARTLYPATIQDANGNLISITYKSPPAPNFHRRQIQTITDTLGRVILFHYDSSERLTAITAGGIPDANGNPTTQTLVRIHYKSLTLDYAFAPMQALVRTGTAPIDVIDAIYFPPTSTGYWFGDSNSYSSYGMIAKVEAQRDMGFSAASLTEQGTVTPGVMVRRQEYDYPLVKGANLSNAPDYETLTETWQNQTSGPAITHFDVQQEASPRTVTVTYPDNTRHVQSAYNFPEGSPGHANDGLVFKDEVFDANNNLMTRKTIGWNQDVALTTVNASRPDFIEETDESGTTRTEYTYSTGTFTFYDQITEERVYGYDGALVRKTVREYENGYYSSGLTFDFCDYIRPRLISLVKDEKVYAADGTTLISRTSYRYDEEYPDAYPPGPPGSGPYQGALVNAPGVTRHQIDFNPYFSTGFFWYMHWIRGRGNLTSIIRYPTPTDTSTAITETRRYDITGNLVSQSTTCCEQINFVYESGTQYAYPSSQTRGAADPNSLARVTTSATYDFNTGLTLTSLDADGRPTTTKYSPITWRPETMIAATGSTTTFEYDDVEIKITQTTRLSLNGAITSQTIKLFNGLGLVRTQKALGPNSTWDIIDTEYDAMGRVSRQTRPYRNGDPIHWISNTYDALGRVNRITLPDGSKTETYYNERDFDLNDSYSPTRPSAASPALGQTALVRDAWGRERWGRADSLSRLVEVVETNPSGNGSVATGGLVTAYSYNVLGKLLSTTQGEQTRSFKYDGLGRLTAQKLAEREATLNAQGQYVGASGTWSDVFTYDIRSNVISRVDARGVKTNFNYNGDPLNRLQSVTFDTTADPNHGLQPTDPDYYLRVLDAPSVTYQYRPKSNPSDSIDVTKVLSITTAGVSTETYGYDSEGRVNSTTLTLTSRPYPMVTTIEYDALDRVTNVTYPAKDLVNQTSRKVVHHDYEIGGRVSELTVDGAKHASQFGYNAASQLKSLLVGPNGPNQITETFAFSDQTGMLDGQTVVRGAGTPGASVLLDLTYDYTDANGKRTGQLTKALNNLNHNRDRQYIYDALGRLKEARGGPASAVRWTQTYTYDRFGNRTAVTASGFSAGLINAGSNTARMLAANGGATAKTHSELPEWLRRYLINSNSNLNSDALESIRALATSESTTPPQGGGVTFTDDPLQPGVTQIKAVHITELRDAVNLARIQAGVGATTWAETVQTGTLIKASHILELRTQLDQARSAVGLPAATYSGPAPSVGGLVLASHIQELRDRVRETLTVSVAIPVDGIGSISVDPATNRINSSGFTYDAAGNQRRIVHHSGTVRKFQYDAANRLITVRTDSGSTTASYVYGSDNRRLISEELNVRTYYAWRADDVIAEYTEEGTATIPTWDKLYIFLGPRLLSTFKRNISGGEITQHHHPDRLGTRLVTTSQTTEYFEQQTLPFGTPLVAESTGETNRRFTSYDRSPATKLDYAINRHYDPQQGRFTQSDPIGMRASSLIDPQSLNLYAYVGNDPISRTDPDGQFWGALFSFLKSLFSSLRPRTINVSFRYGNLAPFGASFSTNLQNIHVSYGPIGIQVRENGTWLPGVREFLASISRSSSQSGGRGDMAEYKRELTEEEWESLEPIFNTALQALDISTCSQYITEDITSFIAKPKDDLNELRNTRHFFFGGKPGSVATTYLHGGFVGSAWIGLRRTFFRSSFWEKVATILHEMRHASSLGLVLHPENFTSEAAKVSWIQGGGVIETQEGFRRGVKKNCIDPLKKILPKR